MNIQIKEIKEDGIIQITTLGERWYKVKDKFLPSVSWICSSYPKGIAFYKWLADKGWDESQAIKNAAGDRGSKVHQAIDLLVAGQEVKMDDKFVNNTSGQPEELTVEEYEALMSFKSWFDEVKPEIIATEQVLVGDGYAGTTDLICKINGEIWLIDYKTSQNIWPEYELQVSAYKHASKEKIEKLGILQIGYNRNKAKWKMNEVEDKFELFLAARKIWENENEGVEPKQKDYPPSLKLLVDKK